MEVEHDWASMETKKADLVVGGSSRGMYDKVQLNPAKQEWIREPWSRAPVWHATRLDMSSNRSATLQIHPYLEL